MLRPVERADWPIPSRFGHTRQGLTLFILAVVHRSENVVERPLDEHLRSILPHRFALGTDERTDVEVPLPNLREQACKYRHDKPPACLPKSRLSRSTPLWKRGRGCCSESDDSEARYCQRLRCEVECEAHFVGESDCILEDAIGDMDSIDIFLCESNDDAVVPEKEQHDFITLLPQQQIWCA